MPENVKKIVGKSYVPISSPTDSQHKAHCSPGYDNVLTRGLKGIKQQVATEISKSKLEDTTNSDKSMFLKAVDITLEATIHFARRYAALAGSLAKEETDARRKAELEKIAETCNWVPENPARSFYEALQSIWFTYIALMIEGWGMGMSFGRVDQYLYPFYKKDLEDGKLSKSEAAELIALLYIKMNEVFTLFSSEGAKNGAGFPMISNITLGGLTAHGRDAVNELSYLFLDVEKDIRLNNEDIVIRVHKNTPDAFLMKACEVARSLRGKLKFISDETAIQQLLTDGKPPEYARDYVVVGCNFPTVPSRSLDLSGDVLNLPMMLELALNNGVSRLTGEQLGPQTGDPRTFKSYEDVWEAYKVQVETLIRCIIPFKNASRQLYAEFLPTPFQSALFDGCIEKGIDITNGGTAPYRTDPISAGGAPVVGDALAAIKKMVFEDKKITMDQLINALDKNFEGEENVLHILKNAPKYGNDNDYVDFIVSDVLIHVGNEAIKYKCFAGAKPTTCAAYATMNVPLGSEVGALPDGRKAREPLSEGGLSPYQGRNVSGPTATMRSVAKLDHLKLTNGSVLNMKFNPDALKDEIKLRKFANLIRTYCETGGFLVQFNIVSSDMLRDAQKHPEKYRDLLVRVATYSAYFVELPSELQNDIIARAEFEEA
jgi:formate C-acetyltransferase